MDYVILLVIANSSYLQLPMEKLKNNKYRLTPQRKVILETLRGIETHPTADEVYKMVREKLPKISLSTVYRNLEILSELGLVRKLALGDTQRRYDGRTKNHYHIRCLHCGKVEDLTTGSFPELVKKVRPKTKYEIVGHCLEFFGVCPECKKRLKKTK